MSELTNRGTAQMVAYVSVALSGAIVGLAIGFAVSGVVGCLIA